MNRLTVISYDIVNDQKRAKAANILKDFGVRVQYSVFECKINEKQLAELKNLLTKAIDLSQDSVRIYSFCQECISRIILIGQSISSVEGPPDYFLV